MSFSVSNLPEDRKGVQNVYLSITNAKGVPMKVAAAKKVMVQSNVEGTQVAEITAQQTRKVSLQNDMRIDFYQLIENRLDPGYYRASIYTDFGLIGATQFQLR